MSCICTCPGLPQYTLLVLQIRVLDNFYTTSQVMEGWYMYSFMLSCNSFFVVNTYRMEKSALPALAVILALALGCGAFFNQPPDKFDDNSLLMCYVTNPFFRTGRDQPTRVLEDPPLIPLQQLSEFDQVWLPVSSG